MNIQDIYRRCGFDTPYPYQVRLAECDEFPQVLSIPTGVGKTAAVVLSWIYRRLYATDDIRRSTPRRLVYCLPMRTLVEQTFSAVNRWLEMLNLDGSNGMAVRTHLLMGGEDAGNWDCHPERDAILVGTQDMLLSRALNRGYGMSRFRWPMHFALLNNDALWVLDEVQLMDAGVSTTAQLEGLRRKFETLLPTRSLWMSATLDPQWLATVDFGLDCLGQPHELTNADHELPPVQARLNAPKLLQSAGATMGDTAAVAKTIESHHQRGTRTLAIFNTVRRAIEVYRQLRKAKSEAKLVLIHSRFRQPDRDENLKQLLTDPPAEGTIAITTQVVEAGVDVSAKTLFTELAPWPSLVQRFGRCNRGGEFSQHDPGRAFWFDLPNGDKERGAVANPYTLGELQEARECVRGCDDVSPRSLRRINVRSEIDTPHVLRRRDLIDLFDTTPDLAGNDIDVSRFIRSTEEFDVQVFWRTLRQKTPDPQTDGRAPSRQELCRVPVSDFRAFAKKKGVQDSVWRWDTLDRRWVTVREQDIYPGQTFLVSTSTGGYSADIGWNPDSKSVDELPGPTTSPEALDDDPASELPVWQSIAQHTDDVLHELEHILSALPIDNDLRTFLQTAARWHDRGKAHPVFQEAIVDGNEDPKRPSGWNGRRDVGKAPGRRSRSTFWRPYTRPHFRHELASALAMLAANIDDLSVYLAAAHHGKVRLSIRSLPGEHSPADDPCRLFARGIWDGDSLPETDLGGGVIAPEVALSLECMQLGRSESGVPSWTERMLKLRDHYGVFRLAFLEALLRAADMRASEQAGTRQEVTS